MHNRLFSLIILLICFAKTLFADTACGDWRTYKENKCFKWIARNQSYDEAINTCSQYNATLITITSLEEQQFIETYLSEIILLEKLRGIFNEKLWTGLKYTNNKYKWINDLDANYTNWSEHSPKNNSEYCIEINSDEVLLLGKWSDVLCTKKNLVMCQTLLTNTILQNMLINTIKQTESIIQQLNNKTNSIVKELSEKLEKIIIQQNITTQILDESTYKLNNTMNVLNTTVNELFVSEKQFDYIFSDKWIEFKTFKENNTRKAFIYPNKTQTQVNRSDAIQLCAQNNATLVDIESQDKQILVDSFLNKVNQKTEYFTYWLGGYIDLADNHQYKWLNSGNVIKYENWQIGYPDSNQPYIFISEPNGYGKWLSTTSRDIRNVFCEIIF